MGQSPEILWGIPARTIVADVADQVLNFDFPVWEGMTAKEIKGWILNEYYSREIAWETVGLWKHGMYNSLSGIMPYAVKIAENEIAMGNPFVTVSMEETETRTGDENENETGNRSRDDGETYSRDETGNVKSGLTGNDTSHEKTDGTSNTTGESDASVKEVGSGERATTGSGKDTKKYSDTPQNGLTSVENGTYLTNAEIDDTSSTENQTDSDTRDRTEKRTDSSNQTVGNISDRTDTTSRDSNTDTTNTIKDSRDRTETESQTKKRDKDYTENIGRKQEGFNGMKTEVLKQYQENLINIRSMILDAVAVNFFGILG